MTVAKETSIEDAFGRVIGRQPSPAERERLYRVREALGLSDHDAFWYIVMILEHYDSLYREYPRLIAEHAAATIEGARQAFAAAAAAESAKAERMLAEKVAETSVAMARRMAERPLGWHRVTTLLGAVVTFGAICMVSGAQVSGGTVGWLAARHGSSLGRQVLGAVLSAPSGWMVLVLLVPGLLHGSSIGLRLARDAHASSAQRAYGWMMVSICISSAVACCFLLALTLG